MELAAVLSERGSACQGTIMRQINQSMSVKMGLNTFELFVLLMCVLQPGLNRTIWPFSK